MTSISIVIATYNRPELLNRLLTSIEAQNMPVEVIVVDDASSMNYQLITTLSIKYIKQKINQGPGVCRDVGIHQAQGDWIVIMDDDDYFKEDAIKMLLRHIEQNNYIINYPVFKLPHGNGSTKNNYILLRMADYMNGAILGDFLPVINRQLFLDKLYQYPTSRVGGEHLLWWKIASDYGIPTWSTPMVCVLGTEAEVRLTSPSTQIKRASEHMELAQETLQKFGRILKKDFPRQYLSRLMALVTYALLSGNKAVVYNTLTALKPYKKQYVLFYILSLLPTKWVVRLFTQYRQATLKRTD